MTNLAETVVEKDMQSLTRFTSAEPVISSHWELLLPPETYEFNHTIPMSYNKTITSHTSNIFTLTFQSLRKTFIGRSLFSSSSGSCHDKDVMWQEIGRSCGLVRSCPRPSSRIIIPLSEYVLPLWSTEYFCQILCWLWSPYVIGQTIIFSSCFFFFLLLLSFFSSPNLSGRRLDVYHTLAHGVALVRI